MLCTRLYPGHQASCNRTVLTVLALCSFACAPHIAAFADERQTEHPLVGYCEGVLTEADPPNYVIEYVGIATQIGKFTRTEFVTVDEFFNFEGTFIYRAADGDEFYVEFWGGFISPTDGIGEGLITGGTGKFAGASGNLEGAVHTEDLIHFFSTFEGVISY